MSVVMPTNLEVEQYGCGNPRREVSDEELRRIIEDTPRLALKGTREGSRVVGGGQVIRNIRGMGRVIDWRDSPWTPANGGKIKIACYVNHIPVIRQMEGLDDMVVLRNVLVAQGLMVQDCTDGEGNVGLFTPMNVLCYQARGANSVSAGCEHMHFRTTDPWTKKQLRAAAFLWHLAEKYHDIPFERPANLDHGNGFVVVRRRGQTTHEWVSHMAGFNDRSDPGDLFWKKHREYIIHCVRYYRKHGHMAGA